MPQARQGAVLLNHPGTKSFYLYGGVHHEPLGGISKLLAVDKNDCRWDMVIPDYKFSAA